MSTTPLLLVVRIPQAPEPEQAWNDWYDQTHIPARLELPGFEAAYRFHGASGEFDYLTFYELSETTALSTDGYRALRDREAQAAPDSFEQLTNTTPGLARGVYEPVHPGESPFSVGETSTLFSVGHDVPADKEEEFHAWYDTEHFPAMLDRTPGFLAGRRYRLADPDAVPMEGSRATSPQFISLYSLSGMDVLDSEDFHREKNSPWSSWVRSWYTRQFRVPAVRITGDQEEGRR